MKRFQFFNFGASATKLLFLSGIFFCICHPMFAQVTIAAYGNAYITSKDKSGIRLGKQGIDKWTNGDAQISFYFKISQPGTLTLKLKAKNEGKLSVLNCFVEDKNFTVSVKNKEYQLLPIGQPVLQDTGYIKVTLQGKSKKSSTFADIESLEISGSAIEKGVVHCGTFEPYWTSRGPSVHLKYPLPKNVPIEYFYNEVTVKEGNDPVGSYYMACGFGEGYFGIQVNSETERRILFSVWSPFDTQDPKLIPDSLKIKLLEKGEGVTVGEFGNEGSGGQSFLRYRWITGNTYKFLMQIHPDGNNKNTVYTAYFYAPEKNKWQLIARFLRPQISTYYTNAHSFLENFSPNQGYITRKVEFGNQWARAVDGTWIELTEAVFTHDATASAGVRKDFAGGVEDNRFFLQNCGFFNHSTPFGTKFYRKAAGITPQTDLP